MNKAILAFATLSLLAVSTEAKAWLVPCDGSDLPRCQTACDNAGGSLVTNPHDGTKWCKIPYRVVGSDTADPNVGILSKGGYNLKKGTAAFPLPPSAAESSSSSSSGY